MPELNLRLQAQAKWLIDTHVKKKIIYKAASPIFSHYSVDMVDVF